MFSSTSVKQHLKCRSVQMKLQLTWCKYGAPNKIKAFQWTFETDIFLLLQLLGRLCQPSVQCQGDQALGDAPVAQMSMETQQCRPPHIPKCTRMIQFRYVV